MTTRTVKMYGLGYGASPAEVTITLDGITVYSGTVPTVNTSFPAEGTPLDQYQQICTFELPMDFVGTKPMTCVINSGDCISFHQITANYGVIPTAARPCSNGPDQFYSVAGLEVPDPRTNVFISEVAQNPVRDPSHDGCWAWNLFAGNTLAYDLLIGAASTYTPETLPPA